MQSENKFKNAERSIFTNWSIEIGIFKELEHIIDKTQEIYLNIFQCCSKLHIH